MKLSTIMIRQERRLCVVGGKHGYFHCWEQLMEPMRPSMLVGGAPGGQLSEIYGIVETGDGRVGRYKIQDIRFVDDENSFLSQIDKAMEGKDVLG